MPNFIYYCVCLWCSYHICYTSLQAQNNALPSSAELTDTLTKPLKILSWNIYMLPGLTALAPSIGFAGKVRRAKAIAQQMKTLDYDIIVWQESFHGKSRRVLKKDLKSVYPYQYGPANRGGVSFRSNSGISIFSKIPLNELAQIQYHQCKGADCFARKGALMLAGEWEGQAFQIIGTHLQAEGGDERRIAQCQHIRDELLTVYYKEGVPQIICGDMNIDKKNPTAYPKMLALYGVKAYELASELKHTNGDKMHIDYIFVKENNHPNISVEQRAHIFTKSWSKTQQWLSDHHAISAKIKF